MTLETAIALAGALFIFAATPGPGVIALTARSISGRLSPTLGMAAGMVLGDLIYLTAAILGVTALGKVLGNFFYIVRLIGAVYLILLGVKTFFKNQEPVHGLGKGIHSGIAKNFTAGFMLCLGNPKVILFYVGFLPAFLDMTQLTFFDILLVISIVATVVGSVLIGNVLLAFYAKKWLLKPFIVRLINRCAGTVLMGAGIAIATDQ